MENINTNNDDGEEIVLNNPKSLKELCENAARKNISEICTELNANNLDTKIQNIDKTLFAKLPGDLRQPLEDQLLHLKQHEVSPNLIRKFSLKSSGITGKPYISLKLSPDKLIAVISGAIKPKNHKKYFDTVDLLIGGRDFYMVDQLIDGADKNKPCYHIIPEDEEHRLSSAVFSQDSRFLASIKSRDTICIRDRKNNWASTYLNQGYPINSLAFSSDDTLASISEDGTIRTWEKNDNDTWTCKHIQRLPGEEKKGIFVTFSPDNNLLASLSRERTQGNVSAPEIIHVWDTTTWNNREIVGGTSYNHDEYRLKFLKFLPNGNLTYTDYRGDTFSSLLAALKFKYAQMGVKIYNNDFKKLSENVINDAGYLTKISSDGYLLIPDGEGKVYRKTRRKVCKWDVDRTKRQEIMDAHTIYPERSHFILEIIPDSNYIATATKTGTEIFIWEPIKNFKQLLFKLALFKGKRSQDVVGLGKLANHSILAKEFDETNQEMIKEEINAHSAPHFESTVKKAIKDNNFLDLYALSRHPVLATFNLKKRSQIRNQVIEKLCKLQREGISTKKSITPHPTGLQDIINQSKK